MGERETRQFEIWTRKRWDAFSILPAVICWLIAVALSAVFTLFGVAGVIAFLLLAGLFTAALARTIRSSYTRESCLRIHDDRLTIAHDGAFKSPVELRGRDIKSIERVEPGDETDIYRPVPTLGIVEPDVAIYFRSATRLPVRSTYGYFKIRTPGAENTLGRRTKADGIGLSFLDPDDAFAALTALQKRTRIPKRKPTKVAPIGMPKGWTQETFVDAELIRRLRAEGDVASLCGTLATQDVEEEPSKQRLVLDALKEHPGEDAVPGLARLLIGASVWHTRMDAAITLGEIGGDTSVIALIPGLDDQDENVRTRTADALAKAGSSGTLDPAIPSLQEALSDPFWAVRNRACVTLGMHGDSSVVPAIEPLLYDESSAVRSGARTALMRIGGTDALAALERRVATGAGFFEKRILGSQIQEAVGNR